MHGVLIEEIRIDGFRGLKDFTMNLSETTVLTGMNNVGKTSVLKALQLLFGNSSFLAAEDLYVNKNDKINCIIIDAKIVAIDGTGKRIENFPDIWEIAFGEANIRMDTDGYAYVPLRAKYTFQTLQNSFNREMQVLNEWEPSGGITWQDVKGKKSIIKGEFFQFYYLDAKRDIQDDVKSRTSYLGKMLGDVESNYDPKDIAELEQKISSLNAEAIDKSSVLQKIQESLKGIDATMDSSGKIYVSPFAKKLRDLNKSLTIHYGTEDNSFTMDYHGMGTRSWSSILSFKAFVEQMNDNKSSEGAFLPIIAIEEPESHLHPNAQKQLYRQMNAMPGIKIISTHSPYVAACAELSELRGMYKTGEKVVCGSLPIGKLTSEECRKIKQAVLMSNGELLFAKAIVLAEGETEVQALPIFCQQYWGLTPVETGLSFVDAKGCGNYYPFVVLANAFQIPWYIFSDGETKTRESLNKLLQKICDIESDLTKQPNIFIIPNGVDFEAMLLNDGYQTEIESAIKQLKGDDFFIDRFIEKNNHKSKGREKTSKICPSCQQNIYVNIERIYDGGEGRLAALDDIMEKNKAQLGPVLANCIIESKKPLPPLVVKLFDKIKLDICHE